MISILDLGVRRGHTVDEVAEKLSELLDQPLTADRYGNSAIVQYGVGTIVVIRSGWNPEVVIAEVRANTPSLAHRAYDLLETNTDWPIELVDSTDLHPEDVLLRYRDDDPDTEAAARPQG